MLYVTSYMCDYKYAAEDFHDIYLNAIHKGNNLAHHIIQSYAPEDNITPEKALEIAQEFMRRKYPNYQYVVAVHNDREHLHAHIIMNAVDKNIAIAHSFDEFLGLMQKSGYDVKIGKYISFRGRGEERFRRGDTIGEAYSEMGIRKRIKGVDIKHVPKRIYDDKNVKISNKNRVKYAINDALKVCTNFDEFIAHLRANGMEIKQGVHLSMRVPVAKKFTRTEKLGYEYTEEMLRLYFNNRAEYERIKANHNKTKIEKIAPNAKHSKSAAVYNINTQIRMFNLMGEYGIKTPEELDEKITELEKQEKQYADSIKSVEAMIESNEDKVRAIREYLRLKVYYDEYNSKLSTYDRELYSLDHYYDLKNYEKASENISELKLPDGSLPNADTLDAHIKAEQDRKKLFSEKHKSIMTELRNLHLVKENIKRINNGGNYEIDRLADNAEFDRSAAVHNINHERGENLFSQLDWFNDAKSLISWRLEEVLTSDNLNTQIKMMNLMGEYGFKTYEELETKIRHLKNTISAKNASIKHYAERMEKDKKTVEAIRSYRRLQPVYNEYIGIRYAPEKELFGVEHRLELVEYKKAYETMAAAKLPDGSFPTEEYTISCINTMGGKIADCTEKRNELEKELRNLSLLKENIDSLNGDDLEEDEAEIEETRSGDRYSR